MIYFIKKMQWFISGVSLLLGIMWLWPDLSAAETPAGLPGPGYVIGPYSAPAPQNAAAAAYLGLAPDRGFQPAELKVDLLLIEVFNVYCASCQYMRPNMNELYDRIQADSDLQGRVKMIGIAAGNDQWDIQAEEKLYAFPIMPDDDYIFHRLVGSPATPFLIFARPYPQGRLLVVDSHLGRLQDTNALLAMVRKAYNSDLADVEIKDDGGAATKLRDDAPAIPVSDQQLIESVKRSMSIGDRPVEDFAKMTLPGWDHIYTGRLAGTDQPVFARVVARKIPCMDCHDVFFVYSFDGKGNFLNFVPISIFKYGNRPWSAADVDEIQRRFQGRSILGDVAFNSKVDAVSSATISTELIYDSVDESDRLIEALAQAGHLPPADPQTGKAQGP